MYSNLRIKSIITLIAWMIIFLHGVIPHDHHSVGNQVGISCCTHSHHNDGNNSDEIATSEFNHINPESSATCHFNPDLLGGIDLDGLFLPVDQSPGIVVFSEASAAYPFAEVRVPGINLEGHSPGRAPPSC